MRSLKADHRPGVISLIQIISLIFILLLVLGARECSSGSRSGEPPTDAPSVSDTSSPSPALPSARVQVFYYPWYGTPQIDGEWLHWDQADRHPAKQDLSSDYYPLLGAYSVRDPRVADQHMKWLAQAGVGVAIVTWWGIEEKDTVGAVEQTLPGLMKAAADNGIKIAFMIDAYDGRTVASVGQDIQYLLSKFGDHPASYRTVQPTLYGKTEEPRPVFYVYAAGSFSPKEWGKTIRRLHQDPSLGNPIILSDDLPDELKGFAQVKKGYFDGYFLYGAAGYAKILGENEDFYAQAQQAITQLGALFIPVVGPGFTGDRSTPKKSDADSGETAEELLHWDRNKGETYDFMWNKVVQAGVDTVVITSFNEWHEGTQIEPAKPFSLPAAANSDGTGAYRYMDYEGHYGLTGEKASMAYLNRTRQWVERFLGLTSE